MLKNLTSERIEHLKNEILKAIKGHPGINTTGIARRVLPGGDPHQNITYRLLKRLESEKKVKSKKDGGKRRWWPVND